MKHLFILLILFVFPAFAVYADETERPLMSMTFLNKAHTPVKIEIKETLNKKPLYKYEILEKLILAPREGNTIPVTLLESQDPVREICICTEGGEGYERTCYHFVILLDHSNHAMFELFSKWVYVGEDFWPPMDDFQVVRVCRIE